MKHLLLETKERSNWDGNKRRNGVQNGEKKKTKESILQHNVCGSFENTRKEHKDVQEFVAFWKRQGNYRKKESFSKEKDVLRRFHKNKQKTKRKREKCLEWKFDDVFSNKKQQSSFKTLCWSQEKQESSLMMEMLRTQHFKKQGIERERNTKRNQNKRKKKRNWKQESFIQIVKTKQRKHFQSKKWKRWEKMKKINFEKTKKENVDEMFSNCSEMDWTLILKRKRQKMMFLRS